MCRVVSVLCVVFSICLYCLRVRVSGGLMWIVLVLFNVLVISICCLNILLVKLQLILLLINLIVISMFFLCILFIRFGYFCVSRWKLFSSILFFCVVCVGRFCVSSMLIVVSVVVQVNGLLLKVVVCRNGLLKSIEKIFFVVIVVLIGIILLLSVFVRYRMFGWMFLCLQVNILLVWFMLVCILLRISNVLNLLYSLCIVGKYFVGGRIMFFLF